MTLIKSQAFAASTSWLRKGRAAETSCIMQCLCILKLYELGGAYLFVEVDFVLCVAQVFASFKGRSESKVAIY